MPSSTLRHQRPGEGPVRGIPIPALRPLPAPAAPRKPMLRIPCSRPASRSRAAGAGPRHRPPSSAEARRGPARRLRRRLSRHGGRLGAAATSPDRRWTCRPAACGARGCAASRASAFGPWTGAKAIWRIRIPCPTASRISTATACCTIWPIPPGRCSVSASISCPAERRASWSITARPGAGSGMCRRPSPCSDSRPSRPGQGSGRGLLRRLAAVSPAFRERIAPLHAGAWTDASRFVDTSSMPAKRTWTSGIGWAPSKPAGLRVSGLSIGMRNWTTCRIPCCEVPDPPRGASASKTGASRTTSSCT